MHRIDTQVSASARATPEDAPSSVIHAPEGFQNFDASIPGIHSPTESSENTVVSPETPEAAKSPTDRVSTSLEACR